MNRMLGFLIMVAAAVYLVVSVADFFPKYTAVPELVANQEKLGLVTSTTNLRFHIGQEMVVDIIVVGLLGILGWWLTTTETPQYGYWIVFGIVMVGLIVLWNTPLLPFKIARISPQGAFYYAQVKVELAADTTGRGWVVIPSKNNQHVAVTEIYRDERLIGKKEVVLEFTNNSTLSQYMGALWPVTILGRMRGTRNLASGKFIYTVPGVQVLKVLGAKKQVNPLPAG